MHEPDVAHGLIDLELFELADDSLSGRITADRLACLNDLLRSDVHLRHIYLLYIHDSLRLRGWALGRSVTPQLLNLPDFAPDGSAGVVGVDVERKTKSNLGVAGRTRWSYVHLSSLAIVTLLLTYFGGLAAYLWLGTTHRKDDVAFSDDSAADPNPIATLSGSANVAWSDAARAKPDEAPVRPGEPLRIDAGVVELKLKQGATLVVEGPAEWSIDDGNHATLHAGKVLATVPPQATGFTLKTPTAQIVDLGTEFAVAVDQSGATHVEVRRGEVTLSAHARQTAASDRPTKLRAGDARRVEPSGQVVAAPLGIDFAKEDYARVAGPLKRAHLAENKLPPAKRPEDFRLDESMWIANTKIATGEAQVSMDGGLLRLVNRGYLISRAEYKPSHQRPVRITGKIYFDGPDDGFQLATRSDGVPEGKFCEVREGLEFAFWPNKPDYTKIQVRGPHLQIADVRSKGHLAATPGMVLAFEVIDRGDDAQFAVWQASETTNRYSATARVIHDTTSKQHVVLHNRERYEFKNILYVDGLKIEQPAAEDPEPSNN